MELADTNPQLIALDAAGGRVLVYESYVNVEQTPGGTATATAFGNVTNTTYSGPEPKGYQRFRMFYVNEQGSIYNLRWQGL